MDAAAGSQADHVCETDLCAFNLSLARLAAEMHGQLKLVGDARGADRVTLGKKAAGQVHWNPATDPGRPLVDQLARFTVATKTEILVVENFSGCEAVVEFYEVEVFRANASHFVGLLCGIARAGVHVGHDFIAIGPRIRRQHRSADLDGLILETTSLHLLLGHEHAGR